MGDTVTNEQIVADLTVLIELHDERVSRGADHGARDLAESVVTMLSAAGRLVPEGAEVTTEEQARIMYGDDGMVKGTPGVASVLGRASAEFGDRVETRTVTTIHGPWVEVSSE